MLGSGDTAGIMPALLPNGSLCWRWGIRHFGGVLPAVDQPAGGRKFHSQLMFLDYF